MSAIRTIARELAAAFLAGPWSASPLTERGVQTCGPAKRWIKALARRVLRRFADAPRDVRVLVAFILNDAGFLDAWSQHLLIGRIPLRQVVLISPSMSPLPGAPSTWDVPA